MFTDTTTSAGDGATALEYLTASAAAEAAPADTLADDFADRIALAALAELDDIVRDMRLDHTAGRLTVDALDLLEETAQTRREALTAAARAARSRARRCLHEPAPGTTTETRKRIKQWRAFAKEKAKAGEIGEGELQYAEILFGLRTVRAGEGSMASDEKFGEWLGKSESVARRRRRRLDRAKLVRIEGYGKDGSSCVVVPVLPDGTPVFPDPNMPTGVAKNDRRGWPKMTTDTCTNSDTKKLPPPLVPSVPDEPEGEGAAFDRIEAEGTEAAQALVDGPEAATELELAEPTVITRQASAETSGPEAAPAPPPTVETAPVGSATRAPAAAEPIEFAEFWLAMGGAGRAGREGAARARWHKLTPAELAAIAVRVRLMRGPPDMYAAAWLKFRVWEQPLPAITASPARRHEAPMPAPVPATPEEKARVEAAKRAFLDHRRRSEQALQDLARSAPRDTPANARYRRQMMAIGSKGLGEEAVEVGEATRSVI